MLSQFQDKIYIDYKSLLLLNNKESRHNANVLTQNPIATYANGI